jgi:hypothetical protein
METTYTGIDIDRLDAAMPKLRHSRALLEGSWDPNVPLRDFKQTYDSLLTIIENCLVTLKEQQTTIERLKGAA